MRFSRSLNTLTALAALSLATLVTGANAQTVYAVNNGNATVHKFSATGADQGTFIASGLGNAIDIVVNQAGNFYVSNETDPGTVSEYSPTGNFLTSLNVGSGQTGGLAVTSTGNLLVASPYANTIRAFSPTNADLGVFASTGLNTPVYIAFDATGNVYVDNQGDGTIHRFSATGIDLGIFATTTANYVQQMVFDSGGNLLVANSATGSIVKFSPTGASLGNFASGLNGPEGLAFLPNGNLLVSTDSNVIDQFSPTGAFLGVFASTGLNSPNGLLVVPAAVPEPGSVALLVGLGVTGAGFLARRRARQ